MTHLHLHERNIKYWYKYFQRESVAVRTKSVCKTLRRYHACNNENPTTRVHTTSACAIWCVSTNVYDTVASTWTVYVQVGMKKYAQREFVAVLIKNKWAGKFNKYTTPTSLYATDELGKCYHHANYTRITCRQYLQRLGLYRVHPPATL